MGHATIGNCPFCGCPCCELLRGSEISVDEDIDGWFVECQNCKSRTRVFASQGGAKGMWNKRAKQKTFGGET